MQEEPDAPLWVLLSLAYPLPVWPDISMGSFFCYFPAFFFFSVCPLHRERTLKSASSQYVHMLDKIQEKVRYSLCLFFGFVNYTCFVYVCVISIRVLCVFLLGSSVLFMFYCNVRGRSFSAHFPPFFLLLIFSTNVGRIITIFFYLCMVNAFFNVYDIIFCFNYCYWLLHLCCDIYIYIYIYIYIFI